MKFLLDTNVISEVLRPRPDKRVESWFEATPDETLFLSVISIAEIRRGALALPDGRRRSAIEDWLFNKLLVEYAERIFLIDIATSLVWGDIVNMQHRQGRIGHAMDMYLAATAAVNGCILVTRNERDFANTGVEVLNPWS